MVKKNDVASPSVQNRKASFKFELLDKWECGIILVGTEVKSLRDGQGSLDEAFARIQDNEVWLHGFHIPPYSHGNVQNHEPTRPRKLLLHKREIAKLHAKLTLRGLTLVPTAVYFNDRGIAKVRLSLAKGKRRHDKRQDMKRQQDQRDMDRAMRRGR